MDGPRTKKRSRGGCAGCLRQHKKCDEALPRCGRCSRLDLLCEYSRELRWFHGVQLPRTKHKTSSRRQSAATASQSTPSSLKTGRRTESISLSVTEYDSDDIVRGVSSSYKGTSPPQLAHFSNALSSVAEGMFSSVLPEILINSNNCEVESSLSEAFPQTQGSSDTHRSGRHGTELTPSRGSPDQIHRIPNALFDASMKAITAQDTASQNAYSYFMQNVSLILPADGGVRNGYRQMAVFALSSPTVLDTVISVSTVYMYLRGTAPRSLALGCQCRALESLRKSISVLEASTEPKVDTECIRREVLATILLQVTIETANGGEITRSHIGYAMKLFNQLGYHTIRPTSSMSIVLIQRLTAIDVLSSIFWQSRPLIPLSFWLYQEQKDEPDGSTPSMQETTGCPLWILHALARISHLTSDVNEGKSHHVIISEAHEIERNLIIMSERQLGKYPTAESRGRPLDAVAWCFYWSAVILLQCRVFCDERHSSRVQFSVSKMIQLLGFIPIGCGPDTQISLPLYVMAWAAVNPVHRDIITAKNRQLAYQYPLETRTILTDAFHVIWATSGKNGGSKSSDDSGLGAGLSIGSDPMKQKSLFIC